MKSIRAVVLAICSLAFIAGCTAANVDAARVARDAFYSMVTSPFDSETIEKAGKDIERAAKANAKEPWVHIAKSQLYLILGYRSGNRLTIGSYDARAVEAAEKEAREAAALGPDHSMAQCQLGRIQIILQDYKGAWGTLNRAEKLEENAFYPPYLLSAISIRMNDLTRAKSFLDEAEKRAQMPFQRRTVNEMRINVARSEGDVLAMERHYRKLIELEPDRPHAYGNYGHFLLQRKRYDEAIANLEKAVSIAPYPIAVDDLKRAKLLKEAGPQQEAQR